MFKAYTTCVLYTIPQGPHWKLGLIWELISVKSVAKRWIDFSYRRLVALSGFESQTRDPNYLYLPNVCYLPHDPGRYCAAESIKGKRELLCWLWIRGPPKVACHLVACQLLQPRWSEKFGRTGVGNQVNTYFLGWSELSDLDNSLSVGFGVCIDILPLSFPWCKHWMCMKENFYLLLTQQFRNASLRLLLYSYYILPETSGETHRFVFNLEFLLVLFFDNTNYLK